MWENSTWEIGQFDGRLDWSDSEVEPYSSIGGLSGYPGVPSGEKRCVRKFKRVSMSRRGTIFP
jgi:hypothetical protein